MNQLILLCLIGAAWATHTGNANVVPSDVTQEQYNQSIDRPVQTREVAGVQPSTASFPGYKPVYNLVLSRTVPTFGSEYGKVAGTSVPFYPHVVTSVPVAGVANTGSYPYFPFPYRTNLADTGSYPYFPFPSRTNLADTGSHPYFPFPSRTNLADTGSHPYFPFPPPSNQAVTTAAADCPIIFPFCI